MRHESWSSGIESVFINLEGMGKRFRASATWICCAPPIVKSEGTFRQHIETWSSLSPARLPLLAIWVHYLTYLKKPLSLALYSGSQKVHVRLAHLAGQTKCKRNAIVGSNSFLVKKCNIWKCNYHSFYTNVII